MFRRSTSLILGPGLVYHRWLGRQRGGDQMDYQISRRYLPQREGLVQAHVANPEACGKS
jgi:hypothetical protein